MCFKRLFKAKSVYHSPWQGSLPCGEALPNPQPERSRGLSWSPSNYEELGWKRYFLMSEWDQNRTRASVAIDINARLYSVAIMYPLWLPHSHNVADFCAFLTYFYHLSHTAVTVIIQTGSFRVLNLPHI